MFGPFSPGDSLRVYRLQGRGLVLDLQRALTEPSSPFREAWLAFLTQQAMGRATYVLYDAHHGEGVIQVQYRPHQAAADVAYLAPSLVENPQATGAWSRLLDGVAIELAARGIQRLFASLPESGAELDVFQHSSFAVYAGEDIYRLPEPVPVPKVSELEGLRLQKAEDWAALQKLCMAVTPQRVRQAEGGITAAAAWGRRHEVYVLPAQSEGADDELQAAVSIHRGGLAHWLRVIVRLDACDVAAGLVRWGLARLAGLPPRPVYCNVRQYESGMDDVLQTAGFELHHTRTLMVKQTLAYVKAPAQELVPALAGGAEPIPPAFRSSQRSAVSNHQHAANGKEA